MRQLPGDLNTRLQASRGAGQPDVSIVVPTYNRRELLPRAIDSVLAQTIQRWELIVVDDGSTDGTASVVEPYLADERIRLLRHSNRGPGLSRNAGIQISTGEFTTFLDSDDRYRRKHLEVRLAYLRAHPETEMIQGGFAVIGDDQVLDYSRPGHRISLQNCVVGATFFGRRDAFFALGGFSQDRVFEDTQLWRRAEQQLRVETPPLPRTYLYIRQSDSLTSEAQRAAELSSAA
jgi:glycosyltransferase involved in cell wall biosynthesis